MHLGCHQGHHPIGAPIRYAYSGPAPDDGSDR